MAYLCFGRPRRTGQRYGEARPRRPFCGKGDRLAYSVAAWMRTCGEWRDLVGTAAPAPLKTIASSRDDLRRLFFRWEPNHIASDRSGNNEIWTCIAMAEPNAAHSLRASVSGSPAWSRTKGIAFDARSKGTYIFLFCRWRLTPPPHTDPAKTMFHVVARRQMDLFLL